MSDGLGSLFFNPEDMRRFYSAQGLAAPEYAPQPQPPAQPLAATPVAPIAPPTGTPLQVVAPPPRTQLRATVELQALFETAYLPPYEEQAAEKIYQALAGATGPWYPEIRSLVTRIEVIGPEQPTPPPWAMAQPVRPAYEQDFQAQIASGFAAIRTDLVEYLDHRLAPLEAAWSDLSARAFASQLSDLSPGNGASDDVRRGDDDGRARGDRGPVHGRGAQPALHVAGRDLQDDGDEHRGRAADDDRPAKSQRRGSNAVSPRRETAVDED